MAVFGVKLSQTGYRDENEGVRGENLSSSYDYLMTLKPISVEAEKELFPQPGIYAVL